MIDEPTSGREILRIINERNERLKELAAINQTNEIIRAMKPINETLQQLAMIFPAAWQYPDYTCCRIQFDNKEYSSHNFVETNWRQRQFFDTIDGKSGFIDIYYLKDFIKLDEGPFLKEERHLIENLAGAISGYLNSMSARELLHKAKQAEFQGYSVEIIGSKGRPGRQLLQRFLNKNNYSRDIYHDLMPFKVNEILLVANLYDAYCIEREGRFSEHVLGDYNSVNLASAPRITGVSSAEEAFEQLNTKYFDMIIFMVGVDKSLPVSLSREVNNKFPHIPVYMLLNNNSDVAFFVEEQKKYGAIDRIFVWNGESKVFFAMIKLIEDKINVENDTAIGMVRVILVVEDSPQFSSRYLPLLYGIVMEQMRRIIDDISTDELYKVLRLRARPKILLASNYEEACNIVNEYKDYMLCLITDVKFERSGVEDGEAGFDLVNFAREQVSNLPIIIQSSDLENANRAYELRTTFINKNSESLLQDFRSFITHYLGFGNFIYRDENGQQIATAKSLKEFETLLKTIPEESLIYHAKKNHFSLWLMARGEMHAAKIINPQKASDFESPQKLREYLIDVIQLFRNEQKKGKIVPFEESAILDEHNVVALIPGSLGGKGRGLAFINTFIYNYDFSRQVPNINIQSPITSVIGTNEFEYFMDRYHMNDRISTCSTYDEIRRLFVSCSLTDTLVRRLRVMLKLIDKPIAVRSSGLFEDSLLQPFAGIFETYLLPNNHPDINVRLNQLMDAIKLVFASLYSPEARAYIEAVNYKIEEEKMAVVIQQVVGNTYDDVFYPHISGVAQSYNYYPFGHMKPEEGFALVALGLGKYVVDGGSAYRFSPRYPHLENYTPKELYKNSQLKFLAVDLAKQEVNLLTGEMAGLRELEIHEAERHGTLRHLASTYDPDNRQVVPGIHQPGPRIINFSDILKYDYAPLAKTIETVLDIVKEAMGTPVEIEFAVDLNRDADLKSTFYLLQVKPLTGADVDFTVNLSEIRHEDILLLSYKCMGNGLVSDIRDVIYVDPITFDKQFTQEMALEIDQINTQMKLDGLQYILIGPGRWGSRDKWIGVPVKWPQISNAKVIIETSLEDFPLDASFGSHFFHNVTSMNVGYFSVHPEYDDSFIDYSKLDILQKVNSHKYFRHVRFPSPLKIRMDGRKRLAVITLT